MALLPSVSLAEFDGALPQLATVSGVAAGDTLNIRAQPAFGSDDIGDLKPNARVEVLELDVTGKWARIIHQEGSGWISVRFIKQKPYVTAKSGVPLGLECGGTEPFWGLSIAKDQTLTFDSPERGSRTFELIWDLRSQNNGRQHYAIASQDVQVILRRASCSDGMSDRTYGWAVDVLLGRSGTPTLLNGCCSAQLY